MSLVICSNDAKEQNDLSGDQQSIYKPWSWTNDLSSNLELPANCQVALQSAKIKMDGTILIGDSNKTFYWYFGKSTTLDDTTSDYFADGASQTTSLAVKVQLFEGEAGQTRVTIRELALELQTALNKACLHPNLHNRITVTPKYDAATNKFEAFQFDFGESVAAPYLQANDLPVAVPKMLDALFPAQRRHQRGLVATPTRPTRAPPYTVRIQGVGNEMAMPVALEPVSQSVCLNIPPLDLKSNAANAAKCAFQLIGVLPAAPPNGGTANTCRFACGLSRPTTDQKDGGLLLPDWYRHRNGEDCPNWMNYYDYGMFCNMIGDQPGRVGSKGKMTLFHAVRDPTMVGGDVASGSEEFKRLLKIKIFKYGDGTAGSVDTGCDNAVVTSAGFSADHGYDLENNPLEIRGIYWEVSGQKLRVVAYTLDLSDAAKVEYQLAVFDAIRAKGLNLKPVTQDCWTLIPQMTMNNRGGSGGNQALFFEQFWGVKTWADFDIENQDETSWELQQFLKEGTTVPSRTLMLRDMVNYGAGAGVASLYDYGDAAAGTNIFDGEKQILILQEQAPDLYPRTDMAGLFPLLGFLNRPVVDFSTIVADNFRVTSTSVPDILPSSSIFVRLHGFNQQSMNAKARGKSDIIAHLPRFDGVHDYGPLYLEPNNMVYLDLNNPAPMRMNSFDISLCHSNEQYAEGLIGTTIVILHFRKDPTK